MRPSAVPHWRGRHETATQPLVLTHPAMLSSSRSAACCGLVSTQGISWGCLLGPSIQAVAYADGSGERGERRRRRLFNAWRDTPSRPAATP